MTVVTRTSGCPAGPCTVAILICLFEILEEKDKSTLTYQEPGTWQSLMEVFFGHQHRKPNPPPWPLQSVPRPSMILMEIVGLQNRKTNPQTRQAHYHLRLPDQHQKHLDQRGYPGRCAWTCWLAVDAV